MTEPPSRACLRTDDENNPGYGTIADASLEATAELLAVDPDSLRFALTNRQVQTGNRASIAVKQLGEFLLIISNPHQYLSLRKGTFYLSIAPSLYLLFQRSLERFFKYISCYLVYSPRRGSVRNCARNALQVAVRSPLHVADWDHERSDGVAAAHAFDAWHPRHLRVRNPGNQFPRAVPHQLRERKAPSALHRPNSSTGSRRVSKHVRLYGTL